MFDPMNSDGQNSVNQREKGEKIKKIKKKLPYLLSGASPPLIIHFVFVFFYYLCGTHISHFITLFNPFQPRNNLLRPGFNFLYSN